MFAMKDLARAALGSLAERAGGRGGGEEILLPVQLTNQWP